MSEANQMDIMINGEPCQAELGEQLLDVARRNASHIGFVCDGRGFCSTCELRVLSGSEMLNSPTQAETDWLSPTRLRNNYRLACQTWLERPGSLQVVSRVEILKRQFIASFNPPRGQSMISNTVSFFRNLTTITIQHLEMTPDGLAGTIQRIGPFNFLFPWRNPGKWLQDTSRVIDRQLDGRTSSASVVDKPEVIFEEVDETPPANPYVESVVQVEEPVEELMPIRKEPPAPSIPAQPFDFLPIDDIGEVFNQRLYEGGIYSYAQLATTSPEELARICGTSPERVIRYQWREQAAKFAAEGK